jgi:hypothetical protein
VVEALDPHGMVPTSTSSIYKVIDNIHMLWMGIWIHHHAVTTALVDPEPELGIQAIILGHRWALNDTIVQWLRL